MKKNIRRFLVTAGMAGIMAASITGCGIIGGSGSNETTATEATQETQKGQESKETVKATEPAKLKGLEFDHEIAMEKAKYLSVDAYKDGYYVIKSHKDDFYQQLLVVPEGKSAPEGLSEDIVIVQQPVTASKIDSITLADLLCNIGNGSADKLTLVAEKKENIFNEQIKENMDKGITKYAGSAKEQDIALIKDAKLQVYLCNPALLKEEAYKKVQELGVTPFVSYMHQEEDPLGRIEWVKALGIIYGDMQGADGFYNGQKEIIDKIDKAKAQGKTYAFVCLRKKDNKAYVRRTGDVIAKIGELAGGVNKLSNVNNNGWEEMSIDDFINNYKDTDYLVYFDGHGDKVNTKEDMTAISDKLKEFKAFENGCIWRTSTDYLNINKVGEMAEELNRIFAGEVSDSNGVNWFAEVK